MVLQPGEARDMRITFRPGAAGAYKEVIPLQVNGLYTVNVVISGEQGHKQETSLTVMLNTVPY